MEKLLTQPLISYLSIAIIAFVGGLIGWFTNVIAIRLIFRPIRPIRIPLLNISIQGIIPRRRMEIAKSIAEVIDHELVSFGELIDKYVGSSGLSEIKESIIQGILHITGRKIPAFIFSAFESPLENYIRDFFNNEGDELLKNLVRNYTADARSKVNIASIVEEKINGFDMKHLERLIISIAGKELKRIEQLGALIGFVIGIFQGALVLIF
jgi:uncharacterized membrane protein YheB (UPF0754 family)